MEEAMEFKRKRCRIRDFDYSGFNSYFITICTSNKQPYFSSQALIKEIIVTLENEANNHRFKVYAYCFMPDHLHLLLIGQENAGLLSFIKLFKQKTGYMFKQKTNRMLWQKGYYDHVLRKREGINKISEYIFNNPVRKRIVEDMREYPYSGSLVFSLDEFYGNIQKKR
jgi:putative transposase